MTAGAPSTRTGHADDVRIAAEVFIQNEWPRTTWTGEPESLREERARRRHDAEAREVVVADRGEPELRRLAVGRQSADARHEADDVAERLGALLEVLQLFGRERELESAGLIAFRFGGDGDDLLGVRQRERPQRRLEQAVERRVRAEADGQRQHGRGREGLVQPEKADRRSGDRSPEGSYSITLSPDCIV